MDLMLATLKLTPLSRQNILSILTTLTFPLILFLALLCLVPLWRILIPLTESCIHTTLIPSNFYFANMASLTATLFFPLICTVASLLDTCPFSARLTLCPTIPPSFLIPAPFLTISLRKSTQAGYQVLSLEKLLSRFCAGPFNLPLLLSLFSPKNLECLTNSGFSSISKASKLHVSINSYIHKDSFTTCFDTASKVADIVSYFLLRSFSP